MSIVCDVITEKVVQQLIKEVGLNALLGIIILNAI